MLQHAPIAKASEDALELPAAAAQILGSHPHPIQKAFATALFHITQQSLVKAIPLCGLPRRQFKLYGERLHQKPQERRIALEPFTAGCKRQDGGKCRALGLNHMRGPARQAKFNIP